jgi:hypothetical protein
MFTCSALRDGPGVGPALVTHIPRPGGDDGEDQTVRGGYVPAYQSGSKIPGPAVADLDGPSGPAGHVGSAPKRRLANHGGGCGQKGGTARSGLETAGQWPDAWGAAGVGARRADGSFRRD